MTIEEGSGGPNISFERTESIADTDSCCSLGKGTWDPAVTETAYKYNQQGMETLEQTLDLDAAAFENRSTMNDQQHPALSTVCVMDCDRKERIFPNSHVYKVDNDWYEGYVMLLMRTPEVDNPRDKTPLGDIPKRVSEYFKGKKRRFEFQFQIKMKKLPQGALFLGCEIEQGVKVGALTKRLIGILLAMIRRINPGFHFSWGPFEDKAVTEEHIASGDYEKTHLSFPVEASMDRIVITRPGDQPPTLGQELFETAESVKRRRRTGVGSVDWNTDDTYTMCLWSAYFDWIKWKSCNVPGVSPFSLCRVTGTQPIYLSVYEITSCPSAEYKKHRPAHKECTKNIYNRLEFTNFERTKGGLASVVKRPSSTFLASDNSLPDTESVGSDLETMSRVSHITN